MRPVRICMNSWGRDPRSVTAHVPDRSIGAEETFAEDLDDAAAINAHLLGLSDQVGSRLRNSQLELHARCI